MLNVAGTSLRVHVFALAIILNAPVSAQEAERLLEAAGIQAGLCVHLGCDDGAFTGSLGKGRNLLVHGLAADSASLAKARADIRKTGLYGQVSADLMTPPLLRYQGLALRVFYVPCCPGTLSLTKRYR